MHILVVDDDPIIRKVLHRHLTQWGHEVTLAEDGEEAWQKLAEGTFSFVLSDWVMPKLDGIGLCRRIRAAHLDRYIYIILLTSKSEKSDLVEGIEAGADDFVLKPFDEQELRVRIRSGERVLQLERDLARRNAELEASHARLERAHNVIQQDLQAAARVQHTLLPAHDPNIPGFEAAWLFIPCSVVAGDVFNFVPLDANHVGFYHIDVAGHGIPSAMLSVTVSKFLTSTAVGVNPLKKLDGDGRGGIASPSAVLAELNEEFQADDDTMLYFTMVYGIMEVEKGQIRFGQAAHPYPLHIRAQDASFLGEGGFPIGTLPGMVYEETVVDMALGDRLLLYSDGVTECVNDKGEPFGADRLQAFLEAQRGEALATMLPALESQLRAWKGGAPFEDDVSLLVIERTQAV